MGSDAEGMSCLTRCLSSMISYSFDSREQPLLWSSLFPRHQEVPGYTVGNKGLRSVKVPDTLPKPIMSLSTSLESGISGGRKTCQWKRQA